MSSLLIIAPGRVAEPHTSHLLGSSRTLCPSLLLRAALKDRLMAKFLGEFQYFISSADVVRLKFPSFMLRGGAEVCFASVSHHVR